MNPFSRRITRKWRPGQAAIDGLLATAVYSIAMEVDMAITGNRYSDVRFIQGFMGKRACEQQRFLLLAWVIHFLNGVALAEIYAAVVKHLLPGPDWLRGALFGELFLASAWAFVPLVDKYHPFIKSGELPKLATPVSLVQNVIRHLIFGLVLGWLHHD